MEEKDSVRGTPKETNSSCESGYFSLPRKGNAEKSQMEFEIVKSIFDKMQFVMTRLTWILGCMVCADKIEVVIDAAVINEKEAHDKLCEEIEESDQRFLKVVPERGSAIQLTCAEYRPGCKVQTDQSQLTEVNVDRASGAEANQITHPGTVFSDEHNIVMNKIAISNGYEASVTLLGRIEQTIAITVGHFSSEGRQVIMNCRADHEDSKINGKSTAVLNNTASVNLFRERLFDVALLKFDQKISIKNSPVIQDSARIRIIKTPLIEKFKEPPFCPKSMVLIFGNQETKKAKIDGYYCLNNSNKDINFLFLMDEALELSPGDSGSLVTTASPDGDGYLQAFAYVIGSEVEKGIVNRNRAVALPLWDAIEKVLLRDQIRQFTYQDDEDEIQSSLN